MRKWRERSPLKYATPSAKIFVLALGFVFLGIMILSVQMALNSFRDLIGAGRYAYYTPEAIKMFVVAFILVVAAAVEHVTRSDLRQIKYMVRARLCQPKYGNPLGLRDGQLEPMIDVWRETHGYRIRIRCPSVDFRKVAELEMTISGCLIGDFWGYAVTSKEEAVSGLYVDYFIDNEVQNAEQQNVYDSIADLRRRYE